MKNRLHITRRDFLNGVSLGIAGTNAPIDFLKSQGIDIDYYRPVLTGIRGNHPNSFNYAHKLAFTGSGFIDESKDTGESYDLIVVGGGISGLSAAYFFKDRVCLLYTSPSPRDATLSRMPSSA